MTPEDRQVEFQKWLDSLDDELRAEVPHDLLQLTEEELEDCEACKEFLASFKRTVELCREAPRPCPRTPDLARAAEAAREELRRKGVL